MESDDPVSRVQEDPFEKEVQAIMRFVEQEQPKFKTKFSVGEAVKITDGPFADFLGTIEAIDELRAAGYSIVAVEQAEGGIPLEEFKRENEKKIALVFGHEMYGVSEEVMAKVDKAIEVPQSGTKHSLNISVYAEIVIWEFFKGMER